MEIAIKDPSLARLFECVAPFLELALTHIAAPNGAACKSTPGPEALRGLYRLSGHCLHQCDVFLHQWECKGR